MICFISWSFGWVSYVLKSWAKSQFEGIFGISPSALFSQCLWANLVVSPRPFGCQTRRIPRWGGKGWTDEPHFGTKIKVRIRVDIWLRKFRSISLEKNQKWQDPSFWGVWMATSEEHHIFANDDTMIKRWNWEPIVIHTALMLKLLKQFAGWICLVFFFCGATGCCAWGHIRLLSLRFRILRRTNTWQGEFLGCCERDLSHPWNKKGTMDHPEISKLSIYIYILYKCNFVCVHLCRL